VVSQHSHFSIQAIDQKNYNSHRKYEISGLDRLLKKNIELRKYAARTTAVKWVTRKSGE
jgi:hypothetical protein